MTTSPKSKAEAKRINRQPTKEELAQHEKDAPNVLLGIRKDHRKTQERVERMTAKILYNDRG